MVEFKRQQRSRLVANPGSGRQVLYLSHPVIRQPQRRAAPVRPRRLLYIAPGRRRRGRRPAQQRPEPRQPARQAPPDRPAASRAAKKKGKKREGRGRAAQARRPYGIPRDNPFVGKPGLDEIYSLGLRNPFRFTFDSLTGAIAIGDVGQGCREEIDYRGAGRALGARTSAGRGFEGTRLFNASRAAPGATFPIREYDNPGAGPVLARSAASTGSAVIPGYVVRDPRLAHQYGRLLYTDFANDEIRSLIPSEGGAADDQPTGVSLPGNGAPDSFGETRGGVLWVISDDGPVYRLDPA